MKPYHEPDHETDHHPEPHPNPDTIIRPYPLSRIKPIRVQLAPVFCAGGLCREFVREHANFCADGRAVNAESVCERVRPVRLGWWPRS